MLELLEKINSCHEQGEYDTIQETLDDLMLSIGEHKPRELVEVLRQTEPFKNNIPFWLAFRDTVWVELLGRGLEVTQLMEGLLDEKS